MKQVIAQRNDIVFFIKFFPLVSIHEEAYKKAKAIVCEEDNEKALQMLEDAFEKKELPAPTCDTNAIDEALKVGKALGLSGTPAVIFENGHKVSGALQAPEIIRLVEAATK